MQFIHRDIKPENFLMGTGSKSDVVYLIDYGLSKKYLDPRSGNHIPLKEGKSLTGTARYTSLNNHLGIEQSRRDDLEGLAYVLIYFARGLLPWMGAGINTKMDKYQTITILKRDLPLHQVAGDLPIEFEDFLRYSRSLGFQDRPDYGYLKKMLDIIYFRANFYDATYDWKQISVWDDLCLTYLQKNDQKAYKLQKSIETQFLNSEALNRRRKYGDRELFLPHIHLDPKMIGENLKDGILRKHPLREYEV